MRVRFPGRAFPLGSLVIELPQRFVPGQFRLVWRVITNGVIPGVCSPYYCVWACIGCWSCR